MIPGLQRYSCSNQLSMPFILLVNATSDSFKARNVFIFQHFSFLSCSLLGIKGFKPRGLVCTFDLKPGVGIDTIFVCVHLGRVSREELPLDT